MTSTTGAPLVLLHSPWVGPTTLLPLAEQLRRRGVHAAVPDLRGVVDDPDQLAAALRERLVAAGVDLDVPAAILAHSGAGLLVPLAVRELPEAAAVVLLDAQIPPLVGTESSPDGDFRARLEAMAGSDGRLPPWTSWWPAEAVAELVPDPVQRATISDECPRVPLAWSQWRPEPDPGWERLPIAFLQRSPAYSDQADLASRQGWVIDRADSTHLDCATRPAEVADAVLTALDAATEAAAQPD